MHCASLCSLRHRLSVAVLLTVLVSISHSTLWSQCTNPTIALPDVSIPVDGNIENAYCVTLTFDPAETGLPSGISMDLYHTWQGDLGIWIFANGNYLNIVQRPGVAGSCEGDCPCGDSGDLGTSNNPATYTFTDGGTADPENGMSINGGDYGITADDGCNLGTPGINSFADLWDTFAPGEEISAVLCISDHAGSDSGVAADISFIFPNPVVCGCTDPIADNYDPAASVDDGTCTYTCPPFGTVINQDFFDFCTGQAQTISLVVNAPNASGATYEWSGTNGGTAFLSNTTGSGTIATIPASFVGSIVYQVVITDDEGCQEIATAEVIAYPLPELALTAPPAICQGDSILVEGPPGFATYEWSTGEETAEIVVDSAGAYMLTITDDNGCQAEDEVMLTSVPLPLPRIVGPDSIFLGEEVSIRVLNQFVQYQWSNGAEGSLITVDTPAVYSVTVTDENGCTGIAELTIAEEIGYNLYIPNAFSPNLDGVNDEFFFQSDGRSVRSVINFQIFDRWGGLVFENRDFPLNQAQEGWDGRVNGEAARAGVYVWFATVELSTREVIQVQGDVLLLGGR
ncbi:MAG: gliding motility-associated C-terminal domain-containing protein [Bacteroidota bacterium]